MKNLSTIGFVGIFMLVLLLPFIFADITGGAVSLLENRVLAARPSISYAFRHPGRFVKEFDLWFTDNIGFRGAIINLYRNVERHLVSKGPFVDGNYLILIGEQGHNYFAGTDGSMISKFQGFPFLSDEQLSGMTNGLNQIKSYLDRKNIPLIVMFCTDKETIYPEFYPNTITRGPEPIQLDIITEYVREHTNIDVFNIKDRLVSAKESYQVYDKIGDTPILSHYNEIGAFFAYQELMTHITKYMPEMRIFTIDDVSITYGYKDIYPEIPDVQLKEKLRYNRLDASFFDDVSFSNVEPYQGYAFENEDSSLPTILFIRDSYTGTGNFLSRYISQQFGKTILIHWSNVIHLEEYIEKYNPDIVIFESAEFALPGFADSMAEWAQ